MRVLLYNIYGHTSDFPEFCQKINGNIRDFDRSFNLV